MAARRGHEGTIAVLLSAGADASARAQNTCGGGGWTPLHTAAAAGEAGAVKVLLQRADARCRTSDGATAIHLAAEQARPAAAGLPG